MDLTKHISELLITNNCVIVPEFGGFIANYKSATIDRVRNKIYPPSKQVLFNPNLVSNDGLLANYVSIQLQKSYADALSLITDEVAVWESKLNQGERITIGDVGFLFKKDNSVIFEQDREFNLLLEAYGLSSVTFVQTPIRKEPIKESENSIPIEIQKKPVIALEIGGDKQIEELKHESKSKIVELATNTPRKKSKWLKYAAVACVLPALFYSYWIPMNTTFLDTGNIQVSDFNPMAKKSVKIYSTRTEKTSISTSTDVQTWNDLTENINSNVVYYNYKFNDELYIPVKLDQTGGSKEVVTEGIVIAETGVNESSVNTSINSDNTIHLIAGCFSSKANAEVLVNELKAKGYPASIVDKNKGLYRVSAQSFSDNGQAQSTKNSLEGDSISTWVLNK